MCFAVTYMFPEKHGRVVMETDMIYGNTLPLNTSKMYESTNLEQAPSDPFQTDGPYYQVMGKRDKSSITMPGSQAVMNPKDKPEDGYCMFFPTNLPPLPPVAPQTATVTDVTIRKRTSSFGMPPKSQDTIECPSKCTSNDDGVYSYIDTRQLNLNMFQETSFSSNTTSPQSVESRNSLCISSSSVSRSDSDPGDTTSNWSDEPIYNYPEDVSSWIGSKDILKQLTHTGKMI